MTEEKKKKSKGLSTAAWYSGQAACNDEKPREVPAQWKEYAKEWLAGYDLEQVY